MGYVLNLTASVNKEWLDGLIALLETVKIAAENLKTSLQDLDHYLETAKEAVAWIIKLSKC